RQPEAEDGDPRGAEAPHRPLHGRGARDCARRARLDRRRPLAARLMVALDPYATEWLDLLLRWLPAIAAIARVVTSFYFVILDQSLRFPRDVADREAGVGGELWEVHGGGFYHVQKYRVAPPELPEHLAWFKWEAYTTWLSGFGLLVVLYYLNAGTYLVDRS